VRPPDFSVSVGFSDQFDRFGRKERVLVLEEPAELELSKANPDFRIDELVSDLTKEMSKFLPILNTPYCISEVGAALQNWLAERISRKELTKIGQFWIYRP
jgi:hypothetical protein